MNKIPKTPAETLRFQGGIWQELHNMECLLETFRKVTARSADAMTDYEEVLKTIAKHSSCKESKADAKYVLNKYKIKS